MELMYKGIDFIIDELIELKLDEAKFKDNYFFWNIEKSQLFISQMIDNEKVDILADWVSCKITITHENRKQIPIVNESYFSESYDFIIEIEKGFVTNKFIEIHSIDNVLSYNKYLDLYYDNNLTINHLSSSNFNHNKENMKNEIMSFFLNLNFVHKDKRLNEIQQYITDKVNNYLYNATLFCRGNHNYKVELFNKLIENIEIVINEKFIFFNFNNNFDFDTGFVVENYIKYLNECFIKKNDFIHINDSTSKINPFVLDFKYIKWAIRNLKWFFLSPSFFESKFTVNQIVELKNTSNLLFEFKYKENEIIVKDYLNEEDYMLNLLKQNIKFDEVNKVYTFKEMTNDSFENYLLDDNISFDMVFDNIEKWGKIGKIIDKLTYYEEDYGDNNIETASEGDWLRNAAGTDDPQTMNDVYWNLD